MARSGSCPSCSAKVPGAASYCPSCGQAIGIGLDLAALDEDDDLEATDEVSPPQRPRRRRDALVALAVVAALVGGAILVSRDGSDSVATPDPSSTTSSSSPRRVPRTTRPTIAPPSTAAYLELVAKGQLLPELTGTLLYGTTSDGQLARIELDTGEVSLRRLPRGGNDPPARLIPRAGVIVVASYVGGESYVVPLDLQGQPVPLPTTGQSQLLPGPAADELWQVAAAFGPGQTTTTVQRIRLDGSPAGPVLELPLMVGRDDGAGRLTGTGASGDLYVFDPVDGRPTLLTETSTAVVDARSVVDVVCNEALSCRWRVRDRASGATRLLEVPPPQELLFSWYGSGQLSPDGRWMVLLDGNSDLRLLDLTSGETRSLGFSFEVYGGEAATWSGDGRWLFWSQNGTLWAWRAGSTDPVRLAGGSMPSLAAVVAVPA